MRIGRVRETAERGGGGQLQIERFGDCHPLGIATRCERAEVGESALPAHADRVAAAGQRRRGRALAVVVTNAHALALRLPVQPDHGREDDAQQKRRELQHRVHGDECEDERKQERDGDHVLV